MPECAIALVTGAGSGLGAAIAVRLARSGLTVAVNTRSRRLQAESVVTGIRAEGGSAFPVCADVTDAAAVQSMFEAIERHGRVRVLVNNASYRPHTPFPDITAEEWRTVHAVTLDGAYLCIRRALATLVPGGRVVNILGRNALEGDPRRVHVSSAKYGLLGLTRALAESLRADGVAVNAVSPGVDCAGEDLDRCRREIAEQVALLAVEPSGLSGTVVRVDCDGSRIVTGPERCS
ncbi:MAG: SDR family NAD(P)-dependent oxidoreductase [Actinobacteria bacterium]|nr:SDR family NAD(P)-dependent oxidoreductase [Actinomycetota bacterium]